MPFTVVIFSSVVSTLLKAQFLDRQHSASYFELTHHSLGNRLAKENCHFIFLGNLFIYLITTLFCNTGDPALKIYPNVQGNMYRFKFQTFLWFILSVLRRDRIEWLTSGLNLPVVQKTRKRNMP